MGERRGTKALELWCRRITDGYPGVNVQNMTTSWRDGLAFCAMIHHFRPDLIDFSSLNKDDIYGNNELAFRTAEQHLGIPALLDAEDMASCSVPDRLSILTYLSQFYQVFGGSSPSRLALNRTSESSNERIGAVPESPKPKVSSRLGMRREPCASCGHPVFLAEKLVVARNAYHRSCFRCARCQHQLTPGNYYETEDGQYCCEACPTDENPNDDDDDDDDDKDDGELIDPSHRELTHSPTQHHHQQQQHHHHHHHHHHHQHHQQRQKQPNASSTPSKKLYSDAKEDDAAVLEAPLSDEEKSKRRSLDRSSSMDRLLRNQRTKLDIMTSHLLGADTSNLDNDKNNDQLDATNDSVVPLTSESDEEKSARSLLLRRDNPVEAEETKEPKKSPLPDVMLPEVDDDDNNDEKFDLMIKLINERIDELITEERTDDKQQRKPIEGEEEKREVSTTKRENEEEREIKPEEIKEKEDVANKTVESSPNATRRYSRDEAPGATATVQLRRASVDGEEPTRRRRRIEQEEQAPATLRRCSSLRSAGEYTKEDRGTSGPEPRRMSLVQRRLRLFESNEPSASLETSRRQQQQQQQQQEPSAQPQRDANEDKQRQPEPRSSLVDNLAKPLPEEKKENTARKTTPSKLETYPEYLNPFASDDDDDDDEDEEPAKAKEKDRQRLSPKKKETSTNPFGSDEEETETVPTTPPPKPAVRTRSGRGATLPQEASKKRVIEAPRINLNPFWSDGEEPESEPESETELRNKSPPVPKPRTFRHSHMEGSFQPKSNLTSSSIYSSNTSIASSCSTITPGGTYRKKKPAPPPPILNQSLTTPHKSHNTSTNSNPSLSPRLTPRTRKTKPAPPPPLPAAASTPTQHSNGSNGNVLNGTNPLLPDGSNGTPDNDARKRTETPVSPPPPPPPALQQQQHQQQSQPPQHLWDDEKLSKDEANRTTQSLSCMDNSSYSSYAHDKSVEGKWKRKKGPAPPRPIPLRRKIKVMSMKDVKLELDQIEMQQQGLEKQGVRLEQIIRDKCESGTTSEDTSLGLDVEELVLELFALVNEKNELFRRQAELMLLRRQQRLEEEYADIEYQVRCLITQPEATKTDFDKQREETLIQRLVEIVERRNEIVECLEMDRRREIEEDRSIHREMDLYAARNKADNVNMTDESRRSSKLKKGKVKEKTKEKKSKKNNKKDADKDVDETETKLKRHSLRKWF